MAEENRWSTRNYDLAKGAVLVIVVILFALAVVAGPPLVSWLRARGDAGQAQRPLRRAPGPWSEALPTPLRSGMTSTAAGTSGAAPVWDAPQTAAGGSLSLSGSAEPGSTVELWAGETKIATVATDGDGHWAYAAQLDPGDHVLVARTVSDEGQVLDESQTVVVHVDAPSAGLQDLAATPEAAVAVVQIAVPEVEPGGALSLSGSAEPGATVELWAGETKIAAVIADGDGHWAYTAQLDPGDHAVVARTVSAEGQVLDESQTVVVHVDAPSAGLQDLAATPEAAVAVVEIAASKVEPGGGLSLSGSAEPGATVELWAGEVKIATVPADGSGSWSYAGQLDPGDHVLVARTVSAEGQVLNESQTVPVSVGSAVAVKVNTPQLSPAGQVILSGTGGPGSTLEVVDNGAVVTSVVVREDGTWIARYTASGGKHTVSVRIHGQAGEGSAAAPVTVTVPTTAGGHSYVVKSGDWLMQLARRNYGNAGRWIDIYNATNSKAAVDGSYHRISNPNWLLPGWKIWIPEP